MSDVKEIVGDWRTHLSAAMVYQLSDAAGPLSVPRPSNPDPDDHNATHR